MKEVKKQVTKKEQATKKVDVKVELKKLLDDGKSRYAAIKALGELSVPVADIARAAKELDVGITYQYAYNVLKSVGKVVTKPRTTNTSAKIREMLLSGQKPMDVAKELNIRPQFVYNVRRQMIDRGQLKTAEDKS